MCLSQLHPQLTQAQAEWPVLAVTHSQRGQECGAISPWQSVFPGGGHCSEESTDSIISCLHLQVTGKKVDDKETGSFLPEDFKNGEYEAAVRLEKQEDLKTVPEHSLTRGGLAYEKDKKLEAEVGSWVFCLDFYHHICISCCSP